MSKSMKKTIETILQKQYEIGKVIVDSQGKILTILLDHEDKINEPLHRKGEKDDWTKNPIEL